MRVLLFFSFLSLVDRRSLEKREENAIKLGIPFPNAKIIDKADGSDVPVSPKRFLILLASIFIGMVLPAFIISFLDMIDNKVHTREDVESIVKSPLIGKIPRNDSKEKFTIGPNDQGPIAESFRILRTNVNALFDLSENNFQCE